MIEKVAEKVITKYLRKGNMTRCLRDILPSSSLSLEQREQVVDIAHDIVRWKKLYDYIIEQNKREKLPTEYIQLVVDEAHKDVSSLPFEYQYSCSDYVASILKKKKSWAEYLNEKPPTSLCVNFNRSNMNEVLGILTTENLTAEQSSLPTAIRTTSTARYSSVIKNKYAHVQDESSQLIAHLTSSLGKSLFDFCAGNGGKSLTIASITRNSKVLHAFEMNTERRIVLEQRCIDYGAKVVVEEKQPDTLFDVVLVDAPCTGVGVARRNPEAKYVEAPGKFPETQLTILKQVTKNIGKNGSILYVVCTITADETNDVVQQFTKQEGFTAVKLDHLPYSNFFQKTKHGAFTTLPGGDLFFISLLKKEG